MCDERYAEDDDAYGTAPSDFLVEQADCLPKGPILCLPRSRDATRSGWLRNSMQ
jgi:hypothetical protein